MARSRESRQIESAFRRIKNAREFVRHLKGVDPSYIDPEAAAENVTVRMYDFIDSRRAVQRKKKRGKLVT